MGKHKLTDQVGHTLARVDDPVGGADGRNAGAVTIPNLAGMAGIPYHSPGGHGFPKVTVSRPRLCFMQYRLGHSMMENWLPE